MARNPYVIAESVETLALKLIGTHHPELATARIYYAFTDKILRQRGQEIHGKSSKISGREQHLSELDFFIEISQDKWNDLNEAQRMALVDHLLECCGGIESEKEGEEGEMKWFIRDPDVREFTSILQRHGAWHSGLHSFVSVAKMIQLDEIVEETTGLDLREETTEEMELEDEIDLNDDDSDD